jgi:hypothetical protein
LDISSKSAPAHQWAYAGDEGNVATYSRLYTWHAVTDAVRSRDERRVALTGRRPLPDGERCRTTMRILS